MEKRREEEIRIYLKPYRMCLSVLAKQCFNADSRGIAIKRRLMIGQ
jgi:hypothetical protein